MSGLSVHPVAGRRDLRRFVELPYRLHRNQPVWVPPLRFERRAFLNRSKNPFFEHAEGEYFLAERDGEVVGRICAHVDHRWDEFQGGNDGMFGFLEAEDDPEVFAALVDTAAAWLRERGRERMLGPMDFTTNDECGLLVEGFDVESMILEPWHPPHYSRHLDGLGLEKAMDLLMWTLRLGDLKQGDRFHDFIEQSAHASEAEHRVRIRHMRKREMEAEVTRFMDVYNEAWGDNWGFVPVTEEEVAFQARNLKPVLDEHWAMMAERDGEVVGAALTLPDINQVLAKMNGRILPFGWWHYLRRNRLITRVRVFALGVKHAYQHMGVAAALYVEHRRMAAERPQTWGHTGWILETNEAMNRAMEGMGGEVVKRYRIYQRAL